MTNQTEDDPLQDLAIYFALSGGALADVAFADAAEEEDAPELPLQSLTREDEGIKPPTRAALAGMDQDLPGRRTLDALHEIAGQGFSAVLEQAPMWIPAKASRAATGDLKLGAAMELRDLMAASRRSLAGGEAGPDERRTTARSLVVAGAANLDQPLWNPADAGSYARIGDPLSTNLLVNLLVPQA